MYYWDEFNEYESFDSDADKLVTRHLDGWRQDNTLPVVNQIPRKFRNIAFGEISRANPSGERRGFADLQQGVLNPSVRNISTTAGSRPVLVTYDNQGRLFVRVFDRKTRRVLWAGQLNERVQGNITEQKIQQILGRALGGMAFTPHRESDRGADLIPEGRAIRNPRNRQEITTRSSLRLNRQPLRPNALRTQPISGRRNNRINRFEETDAFFDNLIDDYLLG